MLKISSFILALIILSACTAGPPAPAELDDFAKCLSEKGAKMYSSYVCSHCKSQKELFGSSFYYVNEIECHPQGPNSQTNLCRQKNVSGTPTWILEPNGIEEKRLAGKQSLESLSAFSGCELNN